MNKLLRILLCIILCLETILPAMGESAFEVRDTKSYEVTEKIFRMDFDSSANLKDYVTEKEWEVSASTAAVIKDGKLTCEAGRNFSIRSGYVLGDDFGLEKAAFSFDLLLNDGEVAIGTRLFTNVSTKDATGLWFTIKKNTITIEEKSSKLKETINHSINLSQEQKVTFEENLSNITLKIGDTVVCVVETGDNLLLKDSSNAEKANVKNEALPKAGYFRMDIVKLNGSVDNIEYIHRDITQKFVTRNDRVIDFSTWIATDDLDRVTPDNSETGDPKNKKYVGLFYFINHVHTGGGEVRDHTKIYLERGVDGLKAFLANSPGGHWAEPYFGYYTSMDEWVYRKHAAMLTAAGVDFIFLDMSNMETYPESHTILFDTWLKIRQEGGTTPQIVPMCGDMPATLVIDLYTISETIFAKPEYDELLFKWEGKPLILGNNDDPEGELWTVSGTTPQTRDQFYQQINSNRKVKEFYESGKFKEVLSKLTVRKSWAWQASNYEKNKNYAGYWDWLDEHPQSLGRSFEGIVEQISVTMGTHAHTSKGRSYVGDVNYGNGKQDFEFTLGTAQYGYCFEQQFKHALKQNPQVIMITGWNEWYAGCIKRPGETLNVGHTPTNGYYLVDQFNPEFSRDGEPMKIRDGIGFGDNYYYQMVSYIRQFKGISETPVASGQTTVNPSRDINAWEDIGPFYQDTLNDTAFRRSISWGGVYMYINNTGRNDLDYAKVSQDNDSITFLITTANDLVTVDETNWMNLFIDIDMKNSTGWEGYDFVINRSRDGSTVSVERFVNNNWEFEKVGDATYAMGQNSLTIKIPKSMLGITDELASFDFKWADNSTTTGNVMEFMDLGDSAPDSRFNFRYLGTAPVKKSSNSFFANLFNPAKWTNTHLLVFTATFAVLIVLVVVIFAKPKKKA